MLIGFEYKGKKISVNAKPCNWLQKFIGLMFSGGEKAEALLLMDFKKPVTWGIHSFFVFFPFAAVWLDDKNRVVDLKIVKPFLPIVHSRRPFHKLVEIPINRKYREIIQFLDGGTNLQKI